MNGPEFLPQIENFLDLTDPLKEEMLLKFAEEKAIPNIH